MGEVAALRKKRTQQPIESGTTLPNGATVNGLDELREAAAKRNETSELMHTLLSQQALREGRPWWRRLFGG